LEQVVITGSQQNPSEASQGSHASKKGAGSQQALPNLLKNSQMSHQSSAKDQKSQHSQLQQSLKAGSHAASK